MHVSSKRSFILFTIIIILVVGAAVVLNNTYVRVIDYDLSVCTMDIPTSSCGPYDVKVRSLLGTMSTYKVAGFTEHNSAKYDKISAKIMNAKDQQNIVILVVNTHGEIISVY